MKVFLCGNFTLWSTGFYVQRAIAKEADNFLVFGPEGSGSKYYHTEWMVNLSELLASKSFTPDILLFMEQHRGKRVLMFLDHPRLRIPKVWWAVDTHLEFRWHKEYAHFFDLVFVAQNSVLSWMKNYGLKNVYWLPLACDPEIHRDYGYERDLDVAFVGNFTEKRRRLFTFLKRELPFLKWGIFEKVYGEEMAKIYSRAKIVVNPAAKKDVNMRTFEAMSCGALLLNEESCDLREIFTIGEDLDVYPGKNIGVLIEKIKYYLDNEGLRKRIALSGQRKVLNEHTYDLRVKKMLEMSKEITTPNYLPERIVLANGLVNFDQQFRNYSLGRRYIREALSKDIWMTIKSVSKYLLYNLKETARRIFKIWPY